MSGSSLEALLDVREWSRGPPGCTGVLGRHSRMSGSGSLGPSGCLGVVGRHFRMFRSGREALPDVRKCLEGIPGCPGVVL